MRAAAAAAAAEEERRIQRKRSVYGFALRSYFRSSNNDGQASGR